MEQKELTNWQAVGIGARVGFGLILLLIIILSLTNCFSPVVIRISIIIGLPAILFGIPGAWIGKSLGKNRLAAWSAAIFGGILGIVGWFMLLVSAVAFDMLVLCK